MRHYTLLLLSLLLSTAANSQVFRSSLAPPPPPASPTGTASGSTTYQLAIDTSFSAWSLDAATAIDANTGKISSTPFTDRGFGRICFAGDHLALGAVHTLYENGSSIGSELIIQLMPPEGTSTSLTIAHDKGIRLHALTSDGTDFYLAYTLEINSGDRDMYVAKISATAELDWTCKVGKRFGTGGMQLLRIDPQGNLVLFAKMYQEVGFDRISPAGQIIDRKMLDFYQDFSPTSFFFKPDGGIVGIGSYLEYEGRNTYTSCIVLELDTNYRLKHYRQLKSPGLDKAQDITMDEEGNYYFLTNTQNSEKYYIHDQDFMTIGKLDANFNLLATTNLRNTEIGHQLNLVYVPGQGLLATQRVYNPRPTFMLFSLNKDLRLEEIYTAPGGYGSPSQLIPHQQQLYLLCGDTKSNLVSIEWRQ